MPSTSRLPALSVTRPWPWLIFNAGKGLENRVWNTKYRGDLLIQAAASWDDRAIPFAAGLHDRDVPGDRREHPQKEIVGVVELYDVCTAARNGGTCGCTRWAFPGQNHWLIRNAVLFPRPVPHPGSLTLWQVHDDAWPAVEAQLKQIGRTVTR